MLIETTSSKSGTDFALANYRISDENLPAFKDMQFEDINELHLDHPGANDPEYRTRRDFIASLSKKFRETGEITDDAAREAARKIREPFLPARQTRSRNLDGADSAAFRNESPFEGIDGLSAGADRRFG